MSKYHTLDLGGSGVQANPLKSAIDSGSRAQLATGDRFVSS